MGGGILPTTERSVVSVPTRTLNSTWGAHIVVAALVTQAAVFAALFGPRGDLAGPGAALVILISTPAVFVALTNWLWTIRSVGVSGAGVTYHYARKQVTVSWPDIRPPRGSVPGGWGPGSGVIFRDLPAAGWTGEAARVVTGEQARAIVDYPSGRTWAPSDGWMRAIQSTPLPLRERIRQLPKWIKIGASLFLFGMALMAVAVVVTTAGIVPGCAFSSYSCPTPDWFNDIAYVAYPALVIGVICLCSGALGWKSPFNLPEA